MEIAAKHKLSLLGVRGDDLGAFTQMDPFSVKSLSCTGYTTILRPASGVLLQWRNRLARRTYKQYLPKRCGGCEFEPHLEHVFSSKYLSKSP